MSAYPEAPPPTSGASLAPPHSIEAEQSVLGAVLLSDKVHYAYVIEEGLRSVAVPIPFRSETRALTRPWPFWPCIIGTTPKYRA